MRRLACPGGLQGGIMKRNDIRPFYLELLELIETLPQN